MSLDEGVTEDTHLIILLVPIEGQDQQGQILQASQWKFGFSHPQVAQVAPRD